MRTISSSDRPALFIFLACKSVQMLLLASVQEADRSRLLPKIHCASLDANLMDKCRREDTERPWRVPASNLRGCHNADTSNESSEYLRMTVHHTPTVAWHCSAHGVPDISMERIDRKVHGSASWTTCLGLYHCSRPDTSRWSSLTDQLLKHKSCTAH